MTGGELIRSARRRLGWSQVMLANKVGLQREDVSKIETGYVGLGERRARKFASVPELHLTAEELLPPQAETLEDLRREIDELRDQVRAVTIGIREGMIE